MILTISWLKDCVTQSSVSHWWGGVPRIECNSKSVWWVWCSTAGETVPVSAEIQALLDTPTATWDNMSEAGLDMLSDIHLSTTSDQPTTMSDQTTMQVEITEQTDELFKLPQALLRGTTWTTRWTRTLIQAIIGTDDNRRCSECQWTFSTMKRLKVHVPQHFTVTFFPCGVHHFYRDAILRHQRTQNCYTGHLYEVDTDSYSKFRDLILPHATSPDRRKALLTHFPPTRPTLESDSDTDPLTTETTTTMTIPAQEIVTRPLWILVSHTGRTVEGNSQTQPTPLPHLPSIHRKKRRSTHNSTDPVRTLDQSILTDVQKLQKRMARLCKEQKRVVTELNKLQARLEERLTQWLILKPLIPTDQLFSLPRRTRTCALPASDRRCNTETMY